MYFVIINIEIEYVHVSDSWFLVGFVLTTGINSAYALGYSGTVMVPLGWFAGSIGFILAAAISLYANALIAKLHEFGGRRHIRYRDLAAHIYGSRKVYSLTWALQYINLFMINTGYIILAGQSLKAIYVLFCNDHIVKLPHFIADGWIRMNAPARDYSIPGLKASKIFSSIGAAANLLFAFNTGMLPEIQATVKQPVVDNMLKALYFQFTAGVLPMYAVTFMGYGPTDLRHHHISSTISQIFASPMYEYMDTRYGRSKGSASAFRVLVRGGNLSVNTLVAALLPFLGDFMSLTGAFSTLPLTFILANHMYLVAKKNKLTLSQKSWHWLNVCVFSGMSAAAAIAALILIATDSKTYHFFADI
ncbi:hypothetical protein MKX01_018035 [Papaver californicum]|nr:hypothetical protein MKX01_018035 [Papaver californicum]